MTATPQPGAEQLRDTIRQSLSLASELGASQAEASASAGAGLSVTVRLREVETLEYHRDQGLALTVYFGQRKGNASTSDLSATAVEETVRKACSLARHAAEDPCAGLADPERLAKNPPDLDLYHPWSLEPAAAIELATRCEVAALDEDARIENSEGASVSTHQGTRAYGNSHGFLEARRSSQHSLSCAVVAAESGAMERDFEYSIARHPDELDGPGRVGREAARKALRRLGARKLKTTEVPVLYPAPLARSLFSHFISAISGGSLYRKASFLVDAKGEQVFAGQMQLREEPLIPKGLASAAYDSEGVATMPRELVRDGVLQDYVLGSYYARKLGLETTGNAGGIHNLVVQDTGESDEDLLTGMQCGLLLCELMGQGVNGVTGDYSRGAAGFWVENGEIQYPVAEITVAGNLRDMYRSIEAVSNEIDLRGGIRTGSVLVGRMTVAGS